LGDPKEVNFDLKQINARNAAAAGQPGAPGAPAPEAERGMSAADKAKYEAQKKEQEAAMAKTRP